MKFIATTSNKVDDINVTSGQLIFSRDDKVIYLDSDIGRTAYKTIIEITEEQRQGMPFPVNGYYYIVDTNVLWNYSDNNWHQISDTPDKRLQIMAHESFPQEGEKGVIYFDSKDMYYWDVNTREYVMINASQWEAIS